MYSLLSTKKTTYSPGLEGLHVHWYHYTASVVFPHLTSELTSSYIIPDQPTVPFWQHNHRSNSGAAGKRAGGDTQGRSGDRVLRCEGSSPPGPGKKKRCSSVLSTCACRASSDHRRSIMIVVSKSSAPLLVPPAGRLFPPSPPGPQVQRRATSKWCVRVVRCGATSRPARALHPTAGVLGPPEENSCPLLLSRRERWSPRLAANRTRFDQSNPVINPSRSRSRTGAHARSVGNHRYWLHWLIH